MMALSWPKSQSKNQLECHDALVIVTVQVRVKLTVHATVVVSVGRDGPLGMDLD
jgi:hypothetical protein